MHAQVERTPIHGDLPFHAWLDGVASSSPRQMCAFALGTTCSVSLSPMMDACVTDSVCTTGCCSDLTKYSPLLYSIFLIEARVMSPTTFTASLDGSSSVNDFQLFATVLPVASDVPATTNIMVDDFISPQLRFFGDAHHRSCQNPTKLFMGSPVETGSIRLFRSRQCMGR